MNPLFSIHEKWFDVLLGSWFGGTARYIPAGGEFLPHIQRRSCRDGVVAEPPRCCVFFLQERQVECLDFVQIIDRGFSDFEIHFFSFHAHLSDGVTGESHSAEGKIVSVFYPFQDYSRCGVYRTTTPEVLSTRIVTLESVTFGKSYTTV